MIAFLAEVEQLFNSIYLSQLSAIAPGLFVQEEMSITPPGIRLRASLRLWIFHKDYSCQDNGGDDEVFIAPVICKFPEKCESPYTVWPKNASYDTILLFDIRNQLYFRISLKKSSSERENCVWCQNELSYFICWPLTDTVTYQSEARNDVLFITGY